MAAALLLTACGKTNAGSGSSGSMSGSSGTSSAQTQTAAWKTGLGVVTEATDQDRAGKIELAAAAVLLDGEGKLESVLLDELEVSVSAQHRPCDPAHRLAHQASEGGRLPAG